MEGLQEHIQVWDNDRKDLWKYISELNSRIQQLEEVVQKQQNFFTVFR